MNCYRGLSLILAAVAVVAVVPADASAQKYEDDRYTREADKFLALAMTRSDDAQRKIMYQQALDALQEGFTNAADNGKLWYTAGIAYVGLSRFADADAAFDKAVEIHPEAAVEIEAEREAGWIKAFTEGVALMDQGAQGYAQALEILEAGEALYPKRPEGLLNMGSMYAELGQNEKAEDAFVKAAAAAQGELYELVDSATRVSWDGYVDMASLNIAQIRGMIGVDAFSAGDFEEAAAAFHRAMEANPYSRDYLLNFVQAKYAKATDLEDEIQADSTKEDEYRPQLIELYSSLQQEIPRVREFDPTNQNVLMINVRAVRRENELKGDSTAAQQGALAILEAADAIPIEVVEVSIQPGDGVAVITGKVLNRKLEADAPVTVKLKLLGLEGNEIGSIDVTVNVGEVEGSVPFEATTNITAQVAGWKYEIAV
ncbi:MAG TPA: tetratricopeptide repeat protein [Longimicrobiales bacterium]|nr:tetratricopeptide repeat protein [Longimicrobiales bacterium]